MNFVSFVLDYRERKERAAQMVENGMTKKKKEVGSEQLAPFLRLRANRCSPYLSNCL
jgi:hypothetical protein